MLEIKPSKDIKFSADRRYIVIANSPTNLGIWKLGDNSTLELVRNVQRLENTNFHVYNANLVYVNMDGSVVNIHNFDVSKEVTRINPDMGLIGYKPNGEPVIFQISADKKERLTDYVIEYDQISGSSCLICKYNDNTFRTVIVSTNGLLFDSTSLGYAVDDINQIKFYDSLIWVPVDSKITTFSYETKSIRDLLSPYVERASRLSFDSEYLRILNPKSCYKVKLNKINKELAKNI